MADEDAEPMQGVKDKSGKITKAEWDFSLLDNIETGDFLSLKFPVLDRLVKLTKASVMLLDTDSTLASIKRLYGTTIPQGSTIPIVVFDEVTVQNNLKFINALKVARGTRTKPTRFYCEYGVVLKALGEMFELMNSNKNEAEGTIKLDVVGSLKNDLLTIANHQASFWDQRIGILRDAGIISNDTLQQMNKENQTFISQAINAVEQRCRETVNELKVQISNVTLKAQGFAVRAEDAEAQILRMQQSATEFYTAASRVEAERDQLKKQVADLTNRYNNLYQEYQDTGIRLSADLEQAHRDIGDLQRESNEDSATLEELRNQLQDKERRQVEKQAEQGQELLGKVFAKPKNDPVIGLVIAGLTAVFLYMGK